MVGLWLSSPRTGSLAYYCNMDNEMDKVKIVKAYLTPNKYSRPQKTGKYIFQDVRGVALHWYEKPWQSAMEAKGWFESAPERKQYGSAQYTVDDKGALQLMDENEMAYHVGAKSYMPLAYERGLMPYPNSHLIGVEMAHPDWSGKPTPLTLRWTVALLVDIFRRYPKLNVMKDLYLHSQITGKVSKGGFQCHRYYMEHPVAFLILKNRIEEVLHEYRI